MRHCGQYPIDKATHFLTFSSITCNDFLVCFSAEFFPLFVVVVLLVFFFHFCSSLPPPHIPLFSIVLLVMHIYSCPPTLYQSLPFKTFLNSKSSNVHSLLFLKTSIAISFSCSILLAGPWPTGLSMSLALPLGSDCRRVFFLTIQSSPFLKFTCFFCFVLLCFFEFILFSLWPYIIHFCTCT